MGAQVWRLHLGGVGTQVIKFPEVLQCAGSSGMETSGEQGQPDMDVRLQGLSQSPAAVHSNSPGRASEGSGDAGGEEGERGLAGAVCKLLWGLCRDSGQCPCEHPAATAVGGGAAEEGWEWGALLFQLAIRQIHAAFSTAANLELMMR